MYRTKIVIEVLSEYPVDTEDLGVIAEQIDTGDWSGQVTNLGPESITKQDMAFALMAQGSDPGFLLGEDGWKYALKNGDEITVDTGDNEYTGTVIVSQAFYRFSDSDGPETEDAVCILTQDGEKIECLLSQIS